MTKHQAQAQLDSLCRKPFVKPKTGIEKELSEQNETKQMWDELKEK